MPENLFISYSTYDSAFAWLLAAQVHHNFSRISLYEDYEKAGPIRDQYLAVLAESQYFVVLFGEMSAASEFQVDECVKARAKLGWDRIVAVSLPKGERAHWTAPERLSSFNGLNTVRTASTDFAAAVETARHICKLFEMPWLGRTGLPAEPNLFSYEKDIIAAYQRLSAPGADLADPAMRDLRDKISLGLPPQWPRIAEIQAGRSAVRNPMVDKIGGARDRNAMVMVTALHRPEALPLVLPEAGPRAELRLTPSAGNLPFKVGIVVGGGIAPGINAVIDGLVSRHWLYAEACGYTAELDVRGLLNGLHAFDREKQYVHLVPHERDRFHRSQQIATAEYAHDGGSIIGTSRDEALIGAWEPDGRLESIVRRLASYRVLYVIGGDGGMRLAHSIRTLSLEPQFMKLRADHGTGELVVVGIPKTMDNDILWMWQAFGFMSAVEKAREMVEHMHTEIQSNPRLGIVQLFGSVSGFVVSHATLAGAAPMCDVALVPEVPFSLVRVAGHLRKRLRERGSVPRGLVVMAETALPTDVLDVLRLIDKGHPGGVVSADVGLLLTHGEKRAVDEFLALRSAGKTMSGHTSDELRAACLKVVSRGLEYLLKADEVNPEVQSSESRWRELRIVTNEPRHIIRAIPPSSQDIITGRRLGALAVDNAVGGYTDFMISQWLTEFVLVPLPLVVLGRKQIHRDGIFWKSVVSKTGAFDVYPATV